MKTTQDNAVKEQESNADKKQPQQTNNLVNLQASEVDGYTDEGLANLNLLAPGEVITKEQNNTSRQISYLSRLLSQRNSLGKARKYPILGTDREQQVKDAINKKAVESAMAQQLPHPIRHTVARGPNLDIYSTFASRDQSIGTLQPNSPATFLEPRHVQNMAGTVGSKKNQQGQRRGGSVNRGTVQQQKQMYTHHPMVVPTQQQAYVSAQAHGPQPHGQSMQPLHPQQPPNVPIFPRDDTNSPVEQIHKLHEQSMATLGEQINIPQLPQHSSALTNNNDVSIYNHMLQNQRNQDAQGDQIPRGTFLNVSSNIGNDSTRLVRYNQLNKGVGDSEFGSPLATNSGNVKYAGQKTIQEILDQDIVDVNNVSRQQFGGSMGIEIDGSFQYINAPHQKDQTVPRENIPDHATKDDSPMRTQSLFNLNHVSSLHIQPSTAAKQNKQDQLESWTKSSMVDQRRGERNQTLNQQRTLPGNLHMNMQSDMEPSFSSNQLPMGLGEMIGPHYPHPSMQSLSMHQNYQSPQQPQFWQVPQNQSMLLAGRGNNAAKIASMHVRLEKQEIDKLLRRVRERKRASIAPDPKIKLDEGHLNKRKWSVHQQFMSPQQQFLFAQQENFISKNPIVIKGIKRRQKSVVHNSDLLGLQVHRGQSLVQQADTLYASGDVHLGQNLNVTDSNHKIIIQDRPSQHDRTGGLPAIEPTQQKANSTAESNNHDGLYQNLFGPSVAPDSMQKFVEVTGDQYTIDEAKSDVLKFQFGGPKQAMDNEHQNRLIGISQQQDGTSTAAGHSLQYNQQHVSAQALNSEYLHHNLLNFQSPIVDTMPGIRSNVNLNQQMSQYSLALDHQADGSKTVKGNMSLPKIKEVVVSPNLRVGGMSARQRSIMLSQKRLAKIQLSRAQTKLQHQRFHTIDNISAQSQYPNAQSLNSLHHPQLVGVDSYLPLFASPSIPMDLAYTQPASQTSLYAMSQQPKVSDNFFQAIEQLPHLPLALKLQAKQLIHNLQKQIRLKKQAVDGQKQANQESLKTYQNLQETKKKLKRAAREVVIYQKKMELEEERRRKEQLENDPDIDQKRQLEREMQELQRQIELNENKIKQEKLDTGMDEQFVDVDLELLEQSNTNIDAKQPSKDEMDNKNQEINENAQQTVLNIDGDAIIQEEVQNYQVDVNQQNHDLNEQNENQPHAKTEQTPPKLGKILSADQPFSPMQQEEILEAPEEDEQQTAKKINSPTYGDDTEEQSPVMMHQELIDKKAEEMRLKPVKTKKELEKLAQNAEVESRIYKLYRDYTQNDLKREKKNAFMALRNMRMQGLAYQNELHALEMQNQHLKKTIQRYKYMTENFEAEHETLQKFLVERRQEKSAKKKKKEFNNMKKKINTKQRQREFDAGGTTSPQVDLGRLRSLIPDFDKIGQEGKDGRPTSKKSGDPSPLAEQEQQYRGGTLPKTNLKVQKPAGALAGLDFSMVSERPDATTISIGSMSARGDVEKVKVQNLEKILHQFKLASKIEKPIDLALQLIDLIKVLFGCTKITFMPIDFYTTNLLTTNLSKEKRNYLRIVSLMDDSDNSQQSITAVSRTQEELCDKVLFKSLKNLTSDIKLSGGGTQFAILIRQSTSGGKVKASSLPTPNDQQSNQNNESIQSPLEIIKKHEPAFIIQGEIAQPNENSSPRKGGKNKQVEQKPPSIKLSYTTLTILQMLCMATQLQFERLRLNQIIRSKGQSEIGELIKMVGRVYKHQNLRALMSGLFTEISTFFNFQDIAIMFHDQEKNQLYTITYGDKEEKELQYKQLLANAKSAEETAVIKAKAAMIDLILPANQLIYFPISVGISSMVFKKQRAIFFNNFNRLNNIYFVEEIDNMKGLKQIDNLLFTHTTRDDGTSNGVIQLFNHPMPITEALRRKLQAISRFYGSCIENIEEKTKKITATLSVQLDPGDNDPLLDSSMKAVDVAKRQYINLQMPFERMEDVLQKNYNMNEQIMAGTIQFDDSDDEREEVLDEV